VEGQPDLFEIVGTLRALSGFAHLLDRGDEQADQDRNDRNDHQQFDQGEGSRTMFWRVHRLPHYENNR
jgi:hypothetical protein